MLPYDVKPCSHVTFAPTSTLASKFNVVSVVMAKTYERWVFHILDIWWYNTITCSHGVNSLRQTLAHMQQTLRVNIHSFSEITLDHQQIRHNNEGSTIKMLSPKNIFEMFNIIAVICFYVLYDMICIEYQGYHDASDALSSSLLIVSC